MYLTNQEIYIAVVSSAHSVCPKGYYIAIVSTIAETTANHHLELAPGFERLGKIEEKFMVSSINLVDLSDQLTSSGAPYSIVRAT
jgi:Rab GDP dissociation inhibitor